MDIGASEHSEQIFSVPIFPWVHSPQSSILPAMLICPGAHFPRCSFALVPLFSKCSLAPDSHTHQWQSAHLPIFFWFSYAPSAHLFMSFFLVPICPHLPQRPSVQSARLSQMSICPSTPCPQYPKYLFVPIAHFPPMPTYPKAHRSQSAHLPQNAHFPKCPFVSVLTCSQCHLSQIDL